jgi:predicted metal-dependent HD superfamily phosphohydrolase
VPTHDAELRAFWQLGVAAANEPFERVLGRYREPHRRYHTTAHLGWVLRHVEELSEELALDDVGAVVAAAFFNDAI